MAHTNSTPNYNLPQFLGTDKPAWLTDINNAMSDIDTAIAAAKTTADTADTAVNGLAVTVGNHTSQLSTLSGAVTSQGNTLNTVTSLIGNGTPTTTDQTIIGAINEINAKVDQKVSVNYTTSQSWAQIIQALESAADLTKLTANAKIDTGSLSLALAGTGTLHTFTCSTPAGSELHVYSIVLENHAFYDASVAATYTRQDASANNPGANGTITLYY